MYGRQLTIMLVMKKIAVLDGIARNDELKITDRANKLMHSVSNTIR